jgi:hypothetical protein
MCNPTTPEFDADAARAAWVDKGRPADPTDPYWASVLAALATPVPVWVDPLVSF